MLLLSTSIPIKTSKLSGLKIQCFLDITFPPLFFLNCESQRRLFLRRRHSAYPVSSVRPPGGVMRVFAVVLVCIYGSVLAFADCSPSKTLKIVFADGSPGLDKDSFGARPKTLYRL